MNKVVLGLLVGGFLGIFDGMTAWFTPAVRAQLLTIVIGSTVKGLIAGVLIGYFAKKVNSLPLGLLFGLSVGLLLAYAVAAMPDPTGKHYYFEIMLPGGIVGMIVGYATQRFGQSLHWPASSAAICRRSVRPRFDFEFCCSCPRQRRLTRVPPHLWGILCIGLASMMGVTYLLLLE